jgi:hypothetical protein
MATGWQMLGDALGGIGDTTAYETGRLRSAQTESAIQEARKRQLESVALDAKQKARAGQKDAMAKAGFPPDQIDLMDSIMSGETGADFSAGMKGLSTGQEINFRNTLADPNAPLGDQFAAGQGVQGKVLPRFDAVGAGGYQDVTKPDAGIMTTPLGDAMIGADNALAGLRNTQTAAGGFNPNTGAANGVKPETGYMANPTYDPTVTDPADPRSKMVIPVPGGSKDPNTGAPLGTRERQVVNRVLNAALNTGTDLETIAMMPATSDQGFLGTGIGAAPGVSVLDAVAGDMKRTIASDDVIKYNSVLGGFSNQLRTMEMMGMAGAASLAAQYDTLAFTPQDTIESKMFKLAGVRQIVENATETILATPNMPDDMKALAQKALHTVQNAVPYSRQDVLALTAAQQKNPGATLNQIIAKRRTAGIVKPGAQPPAAPGRAPAAPAVRAPEPPSRNAQGWELLIDAEGNKAYVSPDGTQIEEIP